MTLSTPKPQSIPALVPKSAEEFKSSGVSAIRAPSVMRRNLFDPTKSGIRLLFFGPHGSGKTYSLRGLIENGWKVLVLSTDIGGSGMEAVATPLRNEGKEESLRGCEDITFAPGDYEGFEAFLKKPTIVFPEIYDWDPDIVMWDGFGVFQNDTLYNYISAMESESKKGPSEQRASGMSVDQKDWGLIRNGTMRVLNLFCAMHNKKTGKVWHKFVTCPENIKSKEVAPGKSALAETKEPFLTGAGGVFIRGAFDLIVKTQVRKAKSNEESDDGKRVFEYVIEGHENLASKNRGFDFHGASVLPGDGYVLFTELLRQRGISKNQIDEKLKSTT